MRAAVLFLAAASLVALGACHRTPSAQTGLTPISTASEAGQAPGLWVERASDHRGVTETRYCLDAQTSTALAAFDRQLNGRCSRHDMAQAADGSWHFATECDLGRLGKVVTEGVMTGDFKSAYRIEAHSQTVGAADPAADGPSRLTVEFRRVSDCPKSMKPGDITLPGGITGRLPTPA